MRKLLVVVLLLSSTNFLMAQTNKINGQASQQNLNELATINNLNGVVNVYDNRYEGVRGTPYFNKNWGAATIKMEDAIFEDIVVKYNVYENKLLYYKKGQLMELELTKVNSFVIKDTLGLHTYDFRKVESMANLSQKLNDRFGLVLHDGSKAKLFILPAKEYIKADYKGTYSSGTAYDQLVDSNTLYFVDNKGVIQKIKLNRKTLLSLLEDRKQQINQFLVKEKINANSEQGWQKTLAFYETL